MKKRYLLYLALCSSLAAGAQSKLDAMANFLIEDYKQITEGQVPTQIDSRLMPAIVARGTVPQVGVIVTLNEGFTPDDITLGGKVEVVQQIADMVIASAPIDALEELGALDAVKVASVGMEHTPAMSRARGASNVDKVQAGTDLDRPYTGKGVVVGLMDTGIDPNHVNFLDADGKTNRVKQAFAYTGSTGVPTVRATTPADVATFDTDNRREDHGTHVSGIMAGSYRGIGNYALGGKKYTDAAIPFYGVAYDADIVMTGGNLYDANIINGVSRVMQYAQSQGKPVAVNLSLGSIVGPHDGSSSLSRALAELGRNGIICVAAGNDGDLKCGTTMYFSRMGGKTRTVGLLTDVATSAISGQLWSDTGDALEAYFVIYDKGTGAEVYTAAIPSGSVMSIGGSGTSYTKVPQFTAGFATNAYIRFQAGVDATNGRYYITFQHLLNRAASSNSNYVPGIKITNKTSGEVIGNITTPGEFTAHGVSTWTDGSTMGSISDMATGDNIICVGAYVSDRSFTSLNTGKSYSYNSYTNGGIAEFTSYGRTPVDDRPHICAPGSALISSLNYWANHNDTEIEVSAFTNSNNRPDRWGPMQGTSMACPYVTGVMGLWLEANPDLTVSQALDIATSTAIKDTYVNGAKTDAERMQWGAGKIDALAGIKAALQLGAGVGSVVKDPDSQLIVTEDAHGVFTAFVAGQSALRATLYGIDGAAVAHAAASGAEVTIDASAATPGIYVLAVEGDGTTQTRKIAIK